MLTLNHSFTLHNSHNRAFNASYHDSFHAVLLRPSDPAQSNLFIAATDFSTGSTAITGRCGKIICSACLRCRSSLSERAVYVINRLGQDNVIVLDATPSTPVTQFSVGNGTNPQDIEVVAAIGPM